MKYRLIILTQKWHRNLGSPKPGSWKNIERQHHNLPEKRTLIAIKRAATAYLLKHTKLPEEYKSLEDLLKSKSTWSNWKYDDWTQTHYRITSNLGGIHLRAEIIPMELDTYPNKIR